MVKTNGHANLQPSQPANLNAACHGLHSDRFLAGEIERHRAELLALLWLTEVDALAVDEVTRLLARIESLDIDLDSRGNARTKTLLENRVRLSRELRAWLRDLGAVPSERANWTAKLTRPSLAEQIRVVLDEDDGSP